MSEEDSRIRVSPASAPGLPPGACTPKVTSSPTRSRSSMSEEDSKTRVSPATLRGGIGLMASPYLLGDDGCLLFPQHRVATMALASSLKVRNPARNSGCPQFQSDPS